MSEYNPLGEWIVDAPTRLEKLLIGDAHPAYAHESSEPSASTLSNGSSSMAVSISNLSDHESNSIRSDNVPSLTQAMTAISISTTSSPSASRSYHNTYHDNHGNVNPSSEESSSSSAAATSTYQCGLDFLGCRRSFNNSNDCYTHSLTHFRNNPPPSTVQCPFCNEWSHTGPNAWAARSTHLAHHRSSGTFPLDDDNVRYRPDHSLYAYLHRIGVVGMMQYQELVRNHRTDATKDAYVEFNNPGKDRRKGIAIVTTRRSLR